MYQSLITYQVPAQMSTRNGWYKIKLFRIGPRSNTSSPSIINLTHIYIAAVASPTSHLCSTPRIPCSPCSEYLPHILFGPLDQSQRLPAFHVGSQAGGYSYPSYFTLTPSWSHTDVSIEILTCFVSTFATVTTILEAQRHSNCLNLTVEII
jgi:hypothetical protein